MGSWRKIGNEPRIPLSALLLCGILNGCVPSVESPTSFKPSSLERSQVPFYQAGQLMVVKGVLNDKVSTDFMVDTGAGITLIPQASASQLGIDLRSGWPTTPFRTGGDITQIPLVVLDSVEIGGMEVTKLKVAVHDSPVLGQRGILGLDFLKNFRVEVNFKEGFLLLEKR